jgi:hypothetical protein
MGDRCYMHITCRRKDQDLFEDIGFHLEFGEEENSPVIEMVDQEANCAHCDEMPHNIPYFGHNGHGDNYSDGIFACTGKRYAEVEAGYAGGFVVAWNTKANRPDTRSLRTIRRYLLVREKVRKLFEKLSATHEQPSTETKEPA